jgi:hypothetical protein
MDDTHRALRDEILRRLDETREDPTVKNTDGSNYWGPRITKAVKDREDDGPALVTYVKSVLRKSGDSEGWNALVEAGRLDLSFEDLVLHADEPIRGLFTDQDRELATQILDDYTEAIGRKADELEAEAAAREAAEIERDRRIVAGVRQRREASESDWTAEIEADMLGGMAARRRADWRR